MKKHPDVVSGHPYSKPDMFISDGKIWRRHRELASPAFSDKNLKFIFEDHVQKITTVMKEKLMKYLGDKKSVEVNFSDESKLLTFDVITTAGFGRELDVLKNSDTTFTQILEKLFFLRGLTVFFGNIIRLFLPLVPSYMHAVNKWMNFVSETVTKRRDEVKLKGSKFHKNDLLSLLMTAQHDEYIAFDDEELKADISLFMAAGMVL